jgi:hypothetical protein
VLSSQEILLTQEQLAAIAADAGDADLKNPHYFHLRGFDIAAIRRVSAKNELVLVQGNEHTGLEHITARHGFFSLKRTWQRDADGGAAGRLDDPSRFRPATFPEFDYLTIADQVYSHGTRDILGNYRQDVFDKYIGEYTFSDGKTEPHVLLLYKGTKVIHTLFPKKSTHNRKSPRSFSFIRGHASTSWNVMRCLVTVTLPYYGPENRLAYALVFEFDSHLKTQEILLWAYNDQGVRTQFMLLSSCSHPSLSNGRPMDFEVGLQYADLRQYEQAIKDTESGKIQRLPEAD